MTNAPTQCNLSDLVGQPYTPDHDCNWLMAEVARRLGTYYPDLVTPADPADWPAMFAESLAKYAIPCAGHHGAIGIFRFIDDKEKEHWHCGTVLHETASNEQPATDKQQLITTTEALGVHYIKMSWEDSKWRIWDLHRTGYYQLRRPKQ